MFHIEGMKRVSVRVLRQRWPEVEKSLRREGELTITRDGKPVAKIVLIQPEEKKRRRFDPEEHAKRMKRLWGNRVFNIVDAGLAEEREDD
jgi:antitoxin (DNA-binding transcriptional repressor) of toxin-antitoxin stability system